MKSKHKYLTLAILRANKACEDRYEYLVSELGDAFNDNEPLSLTQILDILGLFYCLLTFKCFGKKYDDELKTIAFKLIAFIASEALRTIEEKGFDVSYLKRVLKFDVCVYDAEDAAAYVIFILDVIGDIDNEDNVIDNVKKRIKLKLRALLTENGF